ncbi:DUF2793 domain-containing protein [Palleronia rufa]
MRARRERRAQAKGNGKVVSRMVAAHSFPEARPMSDTSPILSLPLMAPAQAQKHVTHNEALVRLDVLAQIAVASRGATVPPSAPAEGEVHIPGPGATGDWSGQDGKLAAFLGGGWVAVEPRDGWIAVEAATGAILVRRGGAWVASASGGVPDTVSALGIGAAADPANPLTASGPATLLTHAGGDHRVKVNKSGATDTASLLFQSGFSGRAEMGLAGEDAFSVKVSADGAAWVTALRLDPATGHLDGAAVQAAPRDVTPGRLMRADYGYGPGNLLGTVTMEAGAPAGAVIESGSAGTGRYVRFADGTQICTGTYAATGVALTTASAGGYRGKMPAVAFARPFAAAPVVSALPETGNNSILRGATPTAADFTAEFWSAISATVSVTGRFTAVGRWV